MDGRALETKTRRYDIDWLRIAAVLLLIPFHTARVFNVGEQFSAKNEQLSTALQRFIVFVGPRHMSLLFVLARAASWFALTVTAYEVAVRRGRVVRRVVRHEAKAEAHVVERPARGRATKPMRVT